MTDVGISGFVIMEANSTYDGFFLNFSSINDEVFSNITQKITNVGNLLQFQFSDQSGYKYFFSFQGQTYLLNSLIIQNRCNSKYIASSLIPFNTSANDNNQTTIISLSYPDLINCGFKRINNGDIWQGIVIFYSNNNKIAYYNKIDIKVLANNDGTFALHLQNKTSDSIVIISTSDEDANFIFSGSLKMYSSNDFTKENWHYIFTNIEENFFGISIINSIVSYSIKIKRVILESYLNIYTEK